MGMEWNEVDSPIGDLFAGVKSYRVLYSIWCGHFHPFLSEEDILSYQTAISGGLYELHMNT